MIRPIQREKHRNFENQRQKGKVSEDSRVSRLKKSAFAPFGGMGSILDGLAKKGIHRELDIVEIVAASKSNTSPNRSGTTGPTDLWGDREGEGERLVHHVKTGKETVSKSGKKSERESIAV